MGFIAKNIAEIDNYCKRDYIFHRNLVVMGFCFLYNEEKSGTGGTQCGRSGRLPVNQYNTDLFISDLSSFGIILSEKQLEQFVQYYELLAEWNERMNLTAITEYSQVIKKHFVDSLALVKACDINSPLSLIDVGTGAGFPGLALKIAFPGLKVTLLDSLHKRIQFLEEVTGRLGLEEVKMVHGRAEDYARHSEMREKFDLCVSRAVARLSVLCEYCLPYVKKGGMFVSYKSEKVSQEVKEAERAAAILGGCMERQVEFTLPDTDIYRNLVVIKKERATPGKYPRKAGLPGREPL